MGNHNTRSTSVRINSRPRRSASTHGQSSTSQFSLSNFVGDLSGRSFLSFTSNHSVYSASRPWSRISRRRWNESTLNNPLEASKTAWPVLHIEAIFLPEYPVTGDFGNRNYKVLEKIAKGAFGHVYKAENIKTDKNYALKVLSKSQVVAENAVRQVKEEVHIQTVCGHHPFIAGSVAHWQSRKELYIVTEYVPGGELLKLIERCDTLPEDLVQLYVAQLALALDFLHNAGVIYRDLKPENVLLDEVGNLKLIDFGLSKWLKSGERTNTLCGTFSYMAPEILLREPYGHAVDWYALGVLAFRMLIGQYPSEAHLTGGGCAGLSCGESARRLLQHLLQADPTRRLRSLRQLKQSAFYLNYSFDDVRAKKTNTRDMIERAEAIAEEYEQHLRAHSQILFSNFEHSAIV